MSRVLILVSPALAAELLAAWLIDRGYDVVTDAGGPSYEGVDVVITDGPLDGVPDGPLVIDIATQGITLETLEVLLP